MEKLSHIDAQGHARMVDVGDKAITAREAIATGTVRMQPETLQLITTGQMPKGDVLAVALHRLARRSIPRDDRGRFGMNRQIALD